MNYLSHAVIAAEFSPVALFVLGSMLPDFANMLRVPLPRLEETQLQDGVRFHHRTDAVFHDLPSFVELNQQALHELRERSVSRGPSRATAHIGIEMLIDAILAEDPVGMQAYSAALRAGASTDAIWAPLPTTEIKRVRRLLEHLAEGGKELHAASAARLSERIGHALAGRPRLEPTALELGVISNFCAGFTEEVRGKMPRIWQDLRAGLLVGERV